MMLLKERKYIKLQRINTTQAIVVGFLMVILVGTLLLMLPFSSATGECTNVVDALFTATSSVCVTGLVTLSTASHWSLFGKIVILVLIQLGGLGVITCVSMLIAVLGKKVTVTERRMIKDSYGLESMAGMVKFVKRVVKGTFVMEGLGTILFAIKFVPMFGPVEGVWKSLFLSVSAFCNAGMDILGEDSLMAYNDSILINTVTIVLIIFGGIGFTVWWDVCYSFSEVRKRKSLKNFFNRLTLHSKLAITISGILVFGGAILVFLFEYTNMKTIGSMTFGNKVLAALFQSVTFRTAGFYTIPQEALTNATVMLAYILMFIGGSPAGTAGGMKTTTVGMLLLTAISTAKSREDTESFGRRISIESIRMAMAVVVIGISMLFFGIMAMCIVMPETSMVDIIFEMVSAIATVGLSRNLTTSLTSVAKLLVIVTMYLGRIGPITIVVALTIRRRDKKGTVKLPEKKIIVG